MDISVVLPTLIKNDKQLGLTAKCIELARQKTQVPFELIIVETETNYLQEYADVYIWEKKKGNSTRSLNRGFQASRASHIVLLTNDVLMDNGWLEALRDTFNRPDCGIATLGTTQFGHLKEDRISEGIWCAVAMFPRKYIPWDENYKNSWDDTDMIMRVYLDGKKSYRNYNVIVDHLVGQTQYGQDQHMKDYGENRAYFIKKYKDYQDSEIYKLLIEGWVL